MDSEEESPSLPPPTNPPPSLPPPLPARPQKVTPLQSLSGKEESIYDNDAIGEVDDELSQQMTASYSEISFKSGVSPENEGLMSLDSTPLVEHILQRPATLNCNCNSVASKYLGPLNLEGTVHVEGNMMHFVAEDLEYKIKLSSPVTKKEDTPPLPGGSRSCTPSTFYRQLLAPQVNQLDSGLLNELEFEAQKMATSIDNLTENLCGILHSISSITADNVEVYKNAVSKMSDAMDSNIKSMYTMMAKTEEVTQAMKTVQSHATRIKEIKRLVDLFESYV